MNVIIVNSLKKFDEHFDVNDAFQQLKSGHGQESGHHAKAIAILMGYSRRSMS
jgi:hypothetical protein